MTTMSTNSPAKERNSMDPRCTESSTDPDPDPSELMEDLHPETRNTEEKNARDSRCTEFSTDSDLDMSDLIEALHPKPSELEENPDPDSSVLMENPDEDSIGMMETLRVSDLKPDREIGADNVSQSSSASSDVQNASKDSYGTGSEYFGGIENVSSSGDQEKENSSESEKVLGTGDQEKENFNRNENEVSSFDSIEQEKENCSENENVGSSGDSGKQDKEKPVKKKGSKKDKNPMKLLKKLMARDSKKSKNDNPYEEVKITSLPQKIITKHLGFSPAGHLYGIKAVRKALEATLKDVRATGGNIEMPLVELHVSERGVNIVEHKLNKGKLLECGLIPIEYISYGVQDIKYTRIFNFILVKELGSKTKKMDCHSFICTSPEEARKLAMSLAFAFEKFAEAHADNPHQFTVDLRPPKELEKDLTKESEYDA